MLPGALKKLVGSFVICRGMPISVTMMMESSMLPLIFRASKIKIKRNPIKNIKALAVWRLPNTKVFLAEATTIPPDFRPIKEIQRPMPPLNAILTLAGMALAMISRMPAKEMMTKITPSMKMMPKAVSTDIPMESRLLMMATEPIPGAKQKGRLV